MSEVPSPISIFAILGALSLLPFFLIMATSFIKISVVLSLLRNALGVQQIPSNMAVHGLALVLSMFIMAPVGFEAYDALEKNNFAFDSKETISASMDAVSVPLTKFLAKHSAENQRKFFVDHAKKHWPEKYKEGIDENSFLVLLPAFTLTELKDAFEIGFMLYIPFLVIDLIVSNILLALGMMMVSPMTISLPFKLLLFVVLDGWTRLLEGLVLSY